MVSAQNVCCRVAAFCDFLYFGMQHDHVLKKVNFDPLIPKGRERGRGRGSAGKIVATMLLHS